MSNKADKLSNTDKLFYANKALSMYWSFADKSKFPSGADYEWFLNQVYTMDGVNYRNEDMPSYGQTVAIYLLDHPYPDENKLREGFQELAEKSNGKIPSKWGLGKVIANASLETNVFDYFTITKKAAIDTAKDFKDIAIVAGSAYATYKVVSLVVAGIVGLGVLMSAMKSKKENS